MKAPILAIRGLARDLWLALRHITGDDAYERYLRHWQDVHAATSKQPPMDRKTFQRVHLQHRWNGIKRCC